MSNIQIDGNKIQQVNKTKFLGIIIEEHLNWTMHIIHLRNIIERNIGILQAVYGCVLPELKLLHYYES